MGLESGIRNPGKKIIFRIPDAGVKKAPDPDPQHWYQITKFVCGRLPKKK
jgi:hypothetical protein